MKLHWRQLLILLVVTFLGSVGFAIGDAVTDWNTIATQACATANAAGRPVPIITLDLAMVHVAIHDAVQAYEKRFNPYESEIQNANGSPLVAVAKAAHDVLVSRFPAQTSTLDTAYDAYLLANNLSQTDDGVAVGQAAAQGIITLRANDGSFPANYPPFVGGNAPGEWRPTPPAFAPGAVPWLGAVTPFAIESTDFCHPVAPPDLSSGKYAADYNEVKRLGSVNSVDRTDEQTALANFWIDNIIQVWSRGLRTIAVDHLNTLGDSARLFALVYLSQADSIICSWESKYFFVLWRPITAIQEGDNDGNDQTVGDANWTPFLITPPYPDYTSGANNVSGSTTRTLHRFFHTDQMDFSLTSNFGPQRNYHKFSEPADEVVEVRILQGIHFRTADKNARKQAKIVADYVFENFLRPIN